jgi:hypothetical protein
MPACACRYHRAMLDDTDRNAPAFDPPDVDAVYARYLERCRCLGVEPVLREQATELLREWADAIATERPLEPIKHSLTISRTCLPLWSSGGAASFLSHARREAASRPPVALSMQRVWLALLGNEPQGTPLDDLGTGSTRSCYCGGDDCFPDAGEVLGTAAVRITV